MDIKISLGIFKWGINGSINNKYGSIGKAKYPFQDIRLYFSIRVSNKYAFSPEMTGVEKCHLHIKVGRFRIYKYLGGLCYDDFATARDNGTITEEEIV